jgi:hypothetical protein
MIRDGTPEVAAHEVLVVNRLWQLAANHHSNVRVTSASTLDQALFRLCSCTCYGIWNALYLPTAEVRVV